MTHNVIMEFREKLDNVGPLDTPWCSTFGKDKFDDLHDTTVISELEAFVDSYNDNQQQSRKIDKPDQEYHIESWGVPIVFPHLRIVVISVTYRTFYEEYKVSFDVLHSPTAGQWTNFDLEKVLMYCPRTSISRSKYFSDHIRISTGRGRGLYSWTLAEVFKSLQYMEHCVSGYK